MMFVFKSLVALLVLASSVSAHPSAEAIHRRHRRVRNLNARTCNPRAVSASASSSSVVVPTTTASVAETEPSSSISHSASHSSSASFSASSSASSFAHSSAATSSSSHSSAHASSTHSSAAPAQTGSLHTALAALAPVSNIVQSWSTSENAPDPLPLSDATFRIHNLLSALSHPYVSAPDGSLAMKATYPEGSYNFQHQPLGGISFYASGPANVDLTTAKEVTLGYSVFFQSGFDFNIGGKLPGIYGGDSDELAVSCSGGSRDNRCMSVRLMWRTKGAGEVYTYLPPGYDANDAVCDIAPFSTCNAQYGASVARGSYTWAAGKWTTVSMRVRLNDVNAQNGEIEMFAGGESVMSVGGLVLRDSDAGRFRGIMMQTFFGGATSNYASPKDQSAYFKDFTLAITEKL